MIKRTILAAALLCSLLLLLCPGTAAQTGAGASVVDERKRFEVGIHFSVLRYEDYGDYVTEPGVGGRFTYNLNDNFAVEAELDFYPRAHESDPTVSGRKTLALFGVKAGWRKGRFGFFGKARPGFIHLSRGLEFACLDGDCSLPNTNFAFDLGGVTEFSLSPRTLLRFDLGDTIIRAGVIGGYNMTHNLQFNAGVGFRF
jgi:Outer membrane protein beta-barrel domain